jgi:hypothetical protein
MASSWGLGKRSRSRCRLPGWAVAGLLLPATGLAQVAPPTINYECPSCEGHMRTWPALAEVGLVQVAVNWFGHYILEDSSQAVTLKSWGDNFREGWEFDDNHFSTNQFAHPYSGNINFNAARANGHDYWQSIPFAALGSLIWEYLGEIHRPALNDYISTTVGGVALGELTWQLSNMVLDNTATGSGRFWKEMAGMGINPARGFNRLFFHDWSRIGPNPDTRTPELMRGAMRVGARLVDKGSGIDKGELQPYIGFDFVHGDPFTQPYTKPFDVFLFSAQINAGDAKIIGRLTTYGRLYSKRLDTGPEPRHVLIVTQDYDYVNTFAYRVGGQSVNLGVLSRYPLNPRFRLATSARAQAIILGAVNSEFVDGPKRDYDFGPGMGLALGGLVSHDDEDVARLGYRLQWIHNVNGLAGDHILQEFTADIAIPVSRTLAVGTQVLYYHRHSAYRTEPTVSDDTPQFQAYLRWRLQ